MVCWEGISQTSPSIYLSIGFMLSSGLQPPAGQETPPATADAVNILSRSYQRPEFRLGGSQQGSVSGGEETPGAQRTADGQKAGRQRRTGTEVRREGQGSG
jgi:hypothetical protein